MKLSFGRSAAIVVMTALLAPVIVLAAAHSDTGCDGCHSPHHGSELPGVPLWSGNEPNTATFELYSSDTLDAQVGQPDGASKLCLSCHDGANPDYAWMASLDPDLVIDDLTTTHPISFVYDSALASADGGLKNPSEGSGLGGTIAEDLLEPGSQKMQCNGCHDVHTSGVGDHLLRGFDYFHGPGGGDLCRMCHLK